MFKVSFSLSGSSCDTREFRRGLRCHIQKAEHQMIRIPENEFHFAHVVHVSRITIIFWVQQSPSSSVSLIRELVAFSLSAIKVTVLEVVGDSCCSNLPPCFLSMRSMVSSKERSKERFLSYQCVIRVYSCVWLTILILLYRGFIFRYTANF